MRTSSIHCWGRRSSKLGWLVLQSDVFEVLLVQAREHGTNAGLVKLLPGAAIGLLVAPANS